MRAITRLTFELPDHILPVIDKIAAERGITRSAVLRQGLGLVKETHEAAKLGLHTGFARDRRQLDTLLVTPF